MNGERKHRVTLPAGQVCPSCKHPVETVVERHKTMGVYVPLWVAGPCRNPHCSRYEPEEAPSAEEEASPRVMETKTKEASSSGQAPT
ncbi:hypothetical protein [Streptomyces thermocarboxydovorans]